MCDPCTKFEEDWTKIVVAIVDERFVRTDTHTQTYSQVILVSVQCRELHWTEKNQNMKSDTEKAIILHHFYLPVRMLWCRNNQFTELVQLTP